MQPTGTGHIVAASRLQLVLQADSLPVTQPTVSNQGGLVVHRNQGVNLILQVDDFYEYEAGVRLMSLVSRIQNTSTSTSTERIL